MRLPAARSRSEQRQRQRRTAISNSAETCRRDDQRGRRSRTKTPSGFDVDLSAEYDRAPSRAKPVDERSELVISIVPVSKQRYKAFVTTTILF